MSRTIRSVWTLASTYGLAMVGMATGLIATPMLVGALGDERFGTFQALLGWTGYVTVLEFGLSVAILPLLAEALSRRDPNYLAQVFGTSGRAFLKAGAVMTVVGAGLMCATPWLIPVPPNLRSELVVASMIAVAAIALYPLSIFRWLMDADQRGYVTNGLLAVQTVLTAVLGVVLARSGAGLAGQMGAALAGATVLGLGFVVAGVSRHPELRRIDFGEDGAVASRLSSLSRPAFLYSLCGRISISSDVMIVSFLLGPAIAARFLLTQRLLIFAAGFVMAVGNSTWAGMAELHNQGRSSDFNRRLVQLTFVSSLLAGAVLVPAAVATPTFVRLWVGGGRYAGDLLTILTFAFVWAQVPVAVWGWAVHATGHLTLLLPCLLAGTAANVIVSVAGTWAIGAAGPALGSSTQYVVVSLVYFPFVLRRVFGVSLLDVWGAVLKPAALTALYAAILWWAAGVGDRIIVLWPRVDQWISMIVAVALAGSGYAVLAWWMIVPVSQRSNCVSRARQLAQARWLSPSRT